MSGGIVTSKILKVTSLVVLPQNASIISTAILSFGSLSASGAASVYDTIYILNHYGLTRVAKRFWTTGFRKAL